MNCVHHGPFLLVKLFFLKEKVNGQEGNLKAFGTGFATGKATAKSGFEPLASPISQDIWIYLLPFDCAIETERFQCAHGTEFHRKLLASVDNKPKIHAKGALYR